MACDVAAIASYYFKRASTTPSHGLNSNASHNLAVRRVFVPKNSGSGCLVRGHLIFSIGIETEDAS